MKYATVITKIGVYAQEALADNMLITFKQDVPAELEDYCFIHRHGEIKGNIQVGDQLQIGETSFQITAIGDVALMNLKELGHVTWCFDGAEQAAYPGMIHVAGSIPSTITEDTPFNILTR